MENLNLGETIVYLEKIQFEIIKLDKQLKEKLNEYNKILYEKFGMQTGKDIDILNIIKVIKKFSDETSGEAK